MNYIQVKVAKAQINFLKLHGALKLPFHTKRKIIGYENEHRELISKFTQSNKEYLKKAEQFLRTYFNGYRDTRWHRFFAAQNGIKKVNYIPDDIYFEIIEKSLNNCELANAYTDKNLLKKLFPAVNTATTIFRIINGRYYSENYNLINQKELKSLFNPNDKYIFKPSIDSGGGKGIVVGHESIILNSVQKVMEKRGKQKQQNYIIEKFLEQHSALNKIHPESLNTLRIVTLRLKNKIHTVSSFLRMGVNKNVVDNFNRGGIICGINKEGKLKKIAFDAVFNKYDMHPNTKIKFDGYQIPSYSNADELTNRLHKDLPHFDLISWDIAISSQSEVKLIEFNLYGQGVDSHQVINGPLFGDLTKEVLETLPQ